MKFIRIQGRRIEYQYAHVDPDVPVIAFLHEGLGSVSMWKDFPAGVAQATGCGTLVYSRYGHGQSDRPAARRGVDFMHEEALHTLPLYGTCNRCRARRLRQTAPGARHPVRPVRGAAERDALPEGQPLAVFVGIA